MDKRHDRLFREGMPVPQDIDGGSAPKPKPKPAPKPAPAASAPKRKDKRKSELDEPGYSSEMVLSGGELVPRFLKDMKDDAPIPRAGMRDRGRGLEVVPDERAKGGAIKKMAKGGVTRADGCAQRGKTKGRMV